MRLRRAVPPVVIAAATVVLLTGCPGPVPNPTPSGSGTASPSDSVGPTPGPTTLPAAVAFVVSGTAVSPDGATTIDFAMTVEAPTQADAAADAAAYASSAHCPPDILAVTPPAIANPAYLHITVDTELTGAAFADEAGVDLGYPGFATTWAGDYQTAQAYCSPPYLAPLPGTARAIGLLENGVVTGPGGWIPATGGYGVSFYHPDAATGLYTVYTLSACEIEFGPASAGTPAAGFVRVDALDGCSFGLLDSP